MIKAKYVRVFDGEIGESVVVPMRTMNHTTKTRRDKEFIATCAVCGLRDVMYIKETTQWGWLSSEHWLNVYCQPCATVTIHHYRIEENDD